MAGGIYQNKMSIIEHLEELRRRIIYSLVFFLAATIFSFIFVDSLSYILRLPALNVIDNFVFISPTEVFTAYLRLAILSGFIISLPFILFQIWLFLKPALPSDKKNSLSIWLVMSFLLSIAGVMFSYFIALPTAIKFLIGFARSSAFPMVSLGKYFSFAGALLLIGAGIFQIPVIMGLLTNIGVLNSNFFQTNRKFAVVAVFIIAAIITPTQDIVNMLIFSAPMLALYEIGILVSWIIERGRRP